MSTERWRYNSFSEKDYATPRIKKEENLQFDRIECEYKKLSQRVNEPLGVYDDKSIDYLSEEF